MHILQLLVLTLLTDRNEMLNSSREGGLVKRLMQGNFEKIFHTFTNAKRMRVVNQSICALRRLQLILSRSMCEYRRGLD
jgi:hypothetical protein